MIDKLPIPAYNIFREEVLIMKYLSVAQIAEKWGLSERTVRNYCAQGRVPDAFLTGKTWNIPDTAEKADRIPKVRKAPTTLLEYLRRDQLQVLPLERDVVWLDAGTADSLMDAGQTIRTIQAETGRYVGCLEELAFNQGWLTEEQVHEAGQELGMTLYGQYLQCL